MKKTHQGSCHCGAVRFEADKDLSKGTFRCNCSICFNTRAWLAGIPAGDFRLLSGKESLADYQFGKKALHHPFCSLDGVDAKELIEAPVKYFSMLHDDMKSPPVETRHL